MFVVHRTCISSDNQSSVNAYWHIRIINVLIVHGYFPLLCHTRNLLFESSEGILCRGHPKCYVNGVPIFSKINL